MMGGMGRTFDGGYSANAHAIGKLKFMPGVTQCRKSIGLAADEMKLAGLLNRSTDPASSRSDPRATGSSSGPRCSSCSGRSPRGERR